MLTNLAKRTLSFVLAMLMVFSLVPVQAFATETEAHVHEETVPAELQTVEAAVEETVVTTEAAVEIVVETESTEAETQPVQTEPAVAETVAETQAVATEPAATEVTEVTEVTETTEATEETKAEETTEATEVTEATEETEAEETTEATEATEETIAEETTEATEETVAETTEETEEVLLEEDITDEAEAAITVTVTYDSALGVVKSGTTDVASGTTASGALVAASKSGSAFLGWISTASNKILSTSASYTPSENVTAVFASASSAAWFRVDGTYLFTDLNAAAAAGTKIVLAADGTLGAGEYTIPAGDTLLIPFDAAETCYDANNTPAWVTERVEPVAYRTLTMANGAKITVNGIMSLSAKHHVITSTSIFGGSPNGSCSFVQMNSGSNISVNGQLHVYGFITGSGSVTINKTGSVYENFQVTDFRGGTATLQMADDTAQHGYGVFPLSQYYIQNVEVPMTLYAGAKEYSVTTIYMSSMGFTSSVPFISGSGSGSMFEMESGYVTKRYDGSRDRLVLEANGAKVAISPIGMQISDAASLDSKQFTLPISNNFTVQVNAGSEVAMKQDIALLPGSEIIIKKGATCTLNGISAYAYDLDQWGNYCGSGNLVFAPLGYAPGRTGTRTSLSDAKVVIEGQMSAQSGSLYTTTGGAAISGVEGAIINVDASKNTKTLTYQAIQTDRAIEYVKIPVTPVKLQNADGSYTETAAESGYYKYANGRWHLPSCGGNTKATVTKAATCTETGMQTISCGCGISYEEVIPMTAHKEKRISAVAATCTETGLTEGIQCETCGHWVKAQEVVTAGGHVWGDIEVEYAPTCEQEGKNKGTCTKCFETEFYPVEKLPHTEIVEEINRKEPTCTLAGGYTKLTFCSICGNETVEKVVLPATGHTYVTTEVVAPTCTEQGYTSKRCYDCGDVIQDDVVAASGHSWDEGTITTPAGCTTEGVVAFECECGATKTELLQPDGHEEVAMPAKEPTCTETGLTAGVKCSKCDTVLTAQDTVAAKGHSYDAGKITTEPTCTGTGVKTKTCTVCGGTATETVAATGHTEVTVKGYAATCTEPGKTDGVACSVCQATVKAQEDISAKGHSWNAGEITSAPTCTGEGIKTYTCTVCSGTKKETVDAKGHTPVVDQAVEATCTKTGLTEGSHCAECPAVLVAQTIVPVKEHSWNAGMITKAPTCTGTGVKTYTCTVCTTATKTETVDATGHTEKPVAGSAATCGKAGLTDGVVCSVCNTTITAQEPIPATGNHSWNAGVITTNPTCTVDGVKTYTCTVCGGTKTEVAAATGHAEETIPAEEATCTKTGLTAGVKCSTCNTILTAQKETPMLDHTPGTAVEENREEATCTVKGSYDLVTYCTAADCGKELSRATMEIGLKDHTPGAAATCTDDQTCTVCFAVLTEALGHDYDEGVVTTAPTCTETGVKTFTCKNDADHTYTEEVKALGHTSKTGAAKEPTCTETGLTAASVCATCGATITAGETIPALGHDYVKTETNAPTCTATGLLTITCSRCDYAAEEIVDALGHKETALEAVAATCTATGLTAGKKCSVCNEVTVAQTVTPMIAHKEATKAGMAATCEIDGLTDGKYCTVCGATTVEQAVIKAEGHKENEGVITTEATCSSKGVKTYSCTVCGKDTKTEDVAEKPHTEVVDEAVPATCTATGLTEGSHCSVCNKVLVAQEETSMIDHNWDDGAITTDPTCTGTGIKTYTCTACTTATKTEPVDALGHTPVVDEAVAATCTATGLTEGSHCSACGDTLVKQETTAMLDHSWNAGEITSAPTCTGTGIKTYTCTVCTTATKTESVEAKGHTPVVDEAVAATCTATGLTEGSHCGECSVVIVAQEVVPMLDHSWDAGVITKEPTCTGTGIKTYTCTVCTTATKTESVEAKGHTPVVDEAVAATCTKTGLTEGSHCSVCGDVITAQKTVDALGHTPGEAVKTNEKAPACTVAGSYDLVTSCTVCGAELSRETKSVEALGHTDEVVKGVAATCTKTGKTDGAKCSVCGVTTKEQEEIPMTEHIPGETVVENRMDSTCVAEGSYDEVAYCTECEKELSRKRTTIEALGHTEVILEAVAPTCTETGLTEGKKCSVCGNLLEAQQIVGSLGHTVEIDEAVDPTCTATGLTVGRHCSVCNFVLAAQEEVPALGHTEVVDEAVEATCTATGLTEGKHCSECDEILVAQEVVPMAEHTWGSGSVTTEPTCTADGVRTFVCAVCLAQKEEAEKALGHDLATVEAKTPTYLAAGYDAYEKCSRCAYSTKVEIPKLEKPVLDTYEEFLENLVVLEQITAEYVEAYPGKDPLALMIKYIRTGVDRYNDGSWNIMAGYEDLDFAKYVQEYEEKHNDQAASIDELICVTILKDIEFFHLPNGNLVDFGHMFGTMDITYHNSGSQNHADVAGWAGDLVDLLDVTSRHNVTGTMSEMIAEIGADFLASTDLNEEDIFSLKDMYGDMDGFYLIEMATAQDYTPGMFSDIVKNYFTASLTDEDRAEFFLQHRLDGVTSRTGLREKVYSEYTGNSMVPTLEATREFQNAGVLADRRKACCYAFADYMCKLAGDYTEVPGNDYYSVFETKTATLAPGITQEINKATTADNKQIVYYIATADVNNPYVDVYANYKSRDPYNEETGTYEWGMSRVRDQVNAAEAVYTDPNSDKYIPNFNAIAGINGSGYNMSTGEPSGLLLMDGVEYHAVDGNGFFGILKDGSAYIGTTAEYHAMKSQLKEGIAGFGSTLVKDGKVSISATSNYYTSRASRTAVGITRTGKVVFMVLDGRQEPVSCGGSMEEIAQIMLEAGCVTAINLDGGGSTTYVAQQPGDDEISLVNKPSDGFERSVSTSLMMVSTAPSSTEFDHAVLSAEYDYMTVGAQVQVTAAGVSAMGNGVDVPAGATWAVGDESIGSIDANSGVFTAKKNGTVQVQLKLDGAVVGTKNLNVVTPNRIYFSKENISMLYGDTVTLPIVGLYNNKNVKMVENDLVYALSNEKAGKAEGFTFTAAQTELTSVKLTAKLKANENINATVTISMFERGEGYFDFDTEATGGNRQLAWNRVVSNATTKDDQTYTVIDSSKPMTTSYRFAIDMTQIPIPERLSDLVYMLPGADVEGANSAWSFLCQLAERISPMTQVKAVVRIDPNFDVDYSDIKLVNDYFELTGTEFDAATNTLTVSLNFIDQTKAIEVDTANAMCILSGIHVTPKSDAAWDAKNRLTPVHSGEISYKVYMRTSALYTFSQNPANQEKYGLYDYVNPNDSYDRGGCFGSVYNTFTDTYVLVNGFNGWTPEGNGYAYYVEGEKLTGICKVEGYYYDFGTDGICVGQVMYTGLLQIDGRNYYSRNGVLVSGWVSVDGQKYCFDENGAGYDGEVTVDGVKILFENGLMVGGQTGFVKKSDGNTYYYEDGVMYYGWLQLGDDWYHFNAENGIMTVGDGTAASKLFPDAEAKAKGAYYVFDKDGRALYGFPNKFGYYYWASQPMREQWVRNGNDLDGVYYTNAYGHFATTPDSSQHFELTLDGVTYTAFKIPVDDNGDGTPDVVYTLDNNSGKLLKGDVVVNKDGTLSYHWAGEPYADGWLTVDGITYYGNKDGSLATGSVVIDGQPKMFTVNGALVESGLMLTAVTNEKTSVTTFTVSNAKNVMSMRLAVWPDGTNPEHTVQWIDATKDSAGNWVASLAMCQFELAGTFQIHAYATVDGRESVLVNSTVKFANIPAHAFKDNQDPNCDSCGAVRKADVKTTPMYRLYNPNSGEHFYTGSVEERDNLVAAGWIYEGVAWNAPVSTGTPVYRVFNPNSGDHHYTMSWEEVRNLEAVGWKYEGVAWNSASADNVPQYRLYNPNADCGSHHYTSSMEERQTLVDLGWIFEGIGWFGIA